MSLIAGSPIEGMIFVSHTTANSPGRWQSLNVGEVGRVLGLAPDLITRLAPFGDFGGPLVVLPDAGRADELLARMAVDPADRATTLAARPDPEEHPELWWVLDRSYRLLLAQIGQRRRGNPGWGQLPLSTGSVGRHLFVWAFLAATPHVRDYHASIGLTDDESWASLSALGAELALSRLLTDRSGLDSTWGLPMIFSGVSFRLGRLAFDRQPPLPPGTDHPLFYAGESGLNVHIPDGGGPLTPEACDASFERALDLTKQFPERVAGFGCHSWLMDTQLQDYLGEESNLIQFQRRFTVFNDRVRADWSPIEHIFHRTLPDPDTPPPAFLRELRQQTTLERAIVNHLQNGGHWYNQTGWFRAEQLDRI
jgi:hypothetical protein